MHYISLSMSTSTILIVSTKSHKKILENEYV